MAWHWCNFYENAGLAFINGKGLGGEDTSACFKLIPILLKYPPFRFVSLNNGDIPVKHYSL